MHKVVGALHCVVQAILGVMANVGLTIMFACPCTNWPWAVRYSPNWISVDLLPDLYHGDFTWDTPTSACHELKATLEQPESDETLNRTF